MASGDLSEEGKSRSSSGKVCKSRIRKKGQEKKAAASQHQNDKDCGWGGRKNVISSDDGKFFLHSPLVLNFYSTESLQKFIEIFLSLIVSFIFPSPTRDTVLMNFQVPWAIRQKRVSNYRIWSYVLDLHSFLRSLFLSLNNVVLVFKI